VSTLKNNCIWSFLEAPTNGYFKPLLDPGGGFGSETVLRGRFFQKRNGHLGAMGVVIEIEGGSVNRCFKTPVIIANTGYRKGLSRKLGYGKSRLSSYIFPRAVEIGRRLLPIFPPLAFRENFTTWKHLFTEPPSMCEVPGGSIYIPCHWYWYRIISATSIQDRTPPEEAN
jgi:hypothetical protein